MLTAHRPRRHPKSPHCLSPLLAPSSPSGWRPDHRGGPARRALLGPHLGQGRRVTEDQMGYDPAPPIPLPRAPTSQPASTPHTPLPGKMRFFTNRSGAAAEVLLQTIRHDAPMPFLGEAALDQAITSDEVSLTSIRALERTCLVCLRKEGAARCELPSFHRPPTWLLKLTSAASRFGSWVPICVVSIRSALPRPPPPPPPKQLPSRCLSSSSDSGSGGRCSCSRR